MQSGIQRGVLGFQAIKPFEHGIEVREHLIAERRDFHVDDPFDIGYDNLPMKSDQRLEEVIFSHDVNSTSANVDCSSFIVHRSSFNETESHSPRLRLPRRWRAAGCER